MAENAPPADTEQRPAKEPSRVLVFTGPKEGVGKSTLALNLALVAVRQGRFETLRTWRGATQEASSLLEPAQGFLEAYALLKGMLIIRIHDRVHAFASQGVCFRVQTHILCIRDLFHAYNDIHGKSILLEWR